MARPRALASAIALAGCTVFDGAGRCDRSCDGPDASSPSDAGAAVPRHDASFGDGGALPVPSSETSTDGDTCFNGVDDDLDGQRDCADTACGLAPYCCIGAAREECCAPSGALNVDFTSCESSDPEACSPDVAAFGQPSAIVEEHAMVPNGGETSDAGLTIGGPVDAMRERITIAARIAASIGSCSDCLDAVGVGIGDAIAGSAVSVHPDVAILVRPARRDCALIIAGEVIDSLPLADAMPHQYGLTLAPDGEVIFTLDGARVGGATWTPRVDRRVVLYGRTHNRPAGAPPPARALSVTVSTRACEIPSALAREASAILGPGDVEARAPSAVSSDGALTVALEVDGDVALARPDGAGGWTIAPVLIAPDGEAYRDPELVRGSDRWQLFVTHERDGASTIARAEGAPDFGETFADPVDLTGPGGVSLSAPSVATWSGTLVAAVALVEGVARIVLLDLNGDGLTWHGGSPSAATVIERRGGLMAFDADEVGGPALFVDGGGLLRVYYAGRRGTRWSIGMIASGDGSTFTPAPLTPLLAPSGAGFDALAVSDPSVVHTDGALQIFYGASDGGSHTIGRATGATAW
jgi:hypothetical protein